MACWKAAESEREREGQTGGGSMLLRGLKQRDTRGEEIRGRWSRTAGKQRRGEKELCKVEGESSQRGGVSQANEQSGSERELGEE